MNIREVLDQRKQHAIESIEVGLDDFLPAVQVRRLSAARIIELTKIKDETEQSLNLVADSIVDEDGHPAFEGIEQVKQLDWPAFQALLRAALQVNGLTKKIADAEKN